MMQTSEKMFNRAFRYTFSLKKCFATFLVVLSCFLLCLLFQEISDSMGFWFKVAFFFIPLFVSTSLLFALGLFVSQMYYHELNESQFCLRRFISESFELLLGAFYLSIPILGTFILLWLIQGVILLMSQVPVLGGLIQTLLVFFPFLLMLSSMLLMLFAVALIFIASPVLAFFQQSRAQITSMVCLRVTKNPYQFLKHLFLALLPFSAMGGVLYLSTCHELVSYFQLQTAEGFFSTLIYTAFTAISLTPFVVFFFNFSCESYWHDTKKEASEVL